jgi:hypothetical protein
MHTRVARQIDEGAPHRRIAHSLGKTTPRLEEILPLRVAYDAITMLDACTLQCSHNDIRDQLAVAFQTLLRPFLAHRGCGYVLRVSYSRCDAGWADRVVEG